jgi:DNA-binding NtrC family response regulator
MSPYQPPFVGPSEALRSFLEELEQAAASEATVLMLGETGVGKAQAARLLHERGCRREGPYVSVNLAATAATLIESTLFGHERGAFTDAHRRRRGLFQKADGGTLVLEDVDLLPRDMQGKLLRVLQERRVEPLGAEDSLPIDVRVVSTSSANLEDAMDAGDFRGDLYYRLAVVPLEVPPLRARGDDLEFLSEGLAQGVSERTGVAARSLSEGAYARLRSHSWPGNVRELENALERVLVLAPKGTGSGGGMPIGPEEFDFLNEACAGIAEDVAGRALRHGLTVEAVTQAMMDGALHEQRGNVSAAARQVGLTRRAFDYRARRPSGSDADAAGEVIDP